MALNKPQVVKQETPVAEEAVAEQEVATQGVVETETVGEELEAEVVAKETVQEPVKEAETTAVATVADKTPIERSTSSIGSPSQFSENMADEGLEGLELDGFSFPGISLPGEGYFQLIGDEDSNLGKHLTVQVESSRARYVIRENDDQDCDSYMSYDPEGKVKSDGSSAEAILAQWEADSGEENYKPVVKKYLDVMATVMAVDEESEDAQELEGEFVVLSIPPASLSKFSGVIARLKMRGKDIRDVSIQASVGKKVKSGKGNFYPWVFKAV